MAPFLSLVLTVVVTVLLCKRLRFLGAIESVWRDDSAISVVLVRPKDWPNTHFYPSSAEVVVATEEEIVATTTLDGATVEILLPGPGEYRILATAEAAWRR